MAMEKRVGFTLDAAQIEQACVAFVASRLLPDEEAKAVLRFNIDGATGKEVNCDILVAKKRKPRTPKVNGPVQTAAAS